MLEASPSVDDESKDTSPLSSRNASRSSTPSTSYFDGTPFFLFPHAHPTLHRRPSSPSKDMAIKPVPPPSDAQTEFQTTARDVLLCGTAVKSLSIPQEDSDRDPASSGGQEPDSRTVPSLGGLSELLKFACYRSRKGRHAQARLYHAQVAIARTSRLLAIARSVRHTLAECIRSEDKQSFANLDTAFGDAVSNCLEPCKGPSEPVWSEPEDSAGYPDSFIDFLPSAQASALLGFLARVRGENSYVAERLSSLSHRELLAILSDRNSSKSNESVLDSSVRSASRASRNLGYVVDSQTDLLTTFEPASPLGALIQSTRSLDKELSDDAAAREIWAIVCGRLVSDQKRGMEKIVPAVIDIWSASVSWPGKKRLEVWIGQTLQHGAFILDQHTRQSFRVRIQGRQDPNAEDEEKIEAFYSSAVNSLLRLFADPKGASVIPDAAVILCQRIFSRLALAGQREAFCKFVLTRWLFNSFIVDAVVLPETHAMATDRFVSDNARQRILREVVLRTQKVVSEVLHPWKHTVPVSTEVGNIVHAIAARFQASPSPEEPLCDNTVHSAQHNPGLIAVSLSDVNVLIDALYPRRRSASLASDSDVARSGLHSSASSVSGFSMFSTPSSSTTTLAYPSAWYQDLPKRAAPRVTDVANVEPEILESYDFADVPSRAEIEASQLRDVRASLEEFVVSERFQSDRQLAVLCHDQDSGTLITQAMKLRAVSTRGADKTDQSPHVPSGFATADYDLCEYAFKTLLLDSDEIGDSDLLSNPSPLTVGRWLLGALHDRYKQATLKGQYVLGHSYLGMACEWERVLSAKGSEGLLQSALFRLEDSAAESLVQTLATIDECETQLMSIQPASQSKGIYLKEYLSQCDLLRYKMLYTADVRTSAAYDEVRSIASALKVMGKPKKLGKSRMVPPLRHLSASKISSNNLHLKTEAQILELLSAAADQGGPNKLSDDQSKALATWLKANDVENVCNGEERLQKLCMEVRKAVDSLTAESSPLWSSSLFARERPPTTGTQTPGATTALFSPPIPSRFDMLRLHTNVSANRDALSSTASSHPLSARSSRDYLETRSPTLTSRSSAAFWSPSMSEAMSPSSATSVGSAHPQAGFAKSTSKDAAAPRSKRDIVADAREQITSLLLSEVTATMFNEGSETDQAFWTGLGGELAKKHLSALRSQTEAPELGSLVYRSRFDFQEAFETIMGHFAASCDPAAKLDFLVEMDMLLELREPVRGQQSISQDTQPDPLKRDTRLVLSNSKVNGFRRLFCDCRVRPSAIFRDLQYIAALIPSVVVGHTDRSVAFWHTSLAITGLKKEICNFMVETADSIIAYHSNNRGHGRSASSAQQQRDSAAFSATSQTPPAEDIAKYSMADAAHLLQITAKEGNNAAQRELATFYLTNPELMDHIIAPLARPREVFKEELESKWRKNQDPARCDPVTMCVAHHWMNLSAKGGDALAKEFLKQREEMERLP